MNINSLVKRKQLLWLSLVAATVGTALAAGWYLSDIDRPVNASDENQSEPAPDMTGVVDATFDDKVQQHATTEMQVAQSEMTKEFKRIDEEIELLSKGRLSPHGSSRFIFLSLHRGHRASTSCSRKPRLPRWKGPKPCRCASTTGMMPPVHVRH